MDSIGNPTYHGPYFSHIRNVDWHSGTDTTAWRFGTPVLCSEKSGEIICWSDSLGGILGRVRNVSYTNGPNWWQTAGNFVFSARYTVLAGTSSSAEALGARYPTVPPFANIPAGDSSCLVAWEQPTYIDYSPFSTNIMFDKLVHTTVGGQPVLTNIPQINYLTVPQGDHHFPSIDLDLVNVAVGNRLYGLSWMEIVPGNAGKSYTRVNFQSLLDTANLVDIGLPLAQLNTNTSFQQRRFVLPSVSATQGADLIDSARFAVVLFNRDTNNKAYPWMKQARIAFRAANFRSFSNYAWGGWDPSGTASAVDQTTRYAALYQDTTSTGQNLMKTSRQFFAKERPHGYIADGRELIMHTDDSTRSAIRTSLLDVWVADDDGGRPVTVVPRNAGALDTLATAMQMFRTANFDTHDSATIGYVLSGFFKGDSVRSAGARVDWIAELVDSATGTVVHVLDSISVSAENPAQHIKRDTTLDLLSGTYFVRMRIDTVSITVPASSTGSRYQVAEAAEYIEEENFGKVKVLSREKGAVARISAQPNPFNAGTEIFFSIPRREQVTMTLHDQTGVAVATLLGNEWMDEGRYSIGIDGSELRSGTYLVELRYGSNQIVEKVVVIR